MTCRAPTPDHVGSQNWMDTRWIHEGAGIEPFRPGATSVPRGTKQRQLAGRAGSIHPRCVNGILAALARGWRSRAPVGGRLVGSWWACVPTRAGNCGALTAAAGRKYPQLLAQGPWVTAIGRTRKPEWSKGHRGFESHPLRHIFYISNNL